MKDLLPYLESRFRLCADVAGRSVVGLSMGGHALDIGLKNTHCVSAIGAFSAATPRFANKELLQRYPSLAGTEPSANLLRHLWIPIGSKDFLLDRNESFTNQLTSLGICHSYVKMSGGHEWRVWRKCFSEYLPMVHPAPRQTSR